MARDEEDREREGRRATSDRILQQLAINEGKVLDGTVVEVGNNFLDPNARNRMNVNQVVALILIQSQASINLARFNAMVFGPRPPPGVPTNLVPNRVEIVRVPLPALEDGQAEKPTPARRGPPEMAGTPPPRKAGPIMLTEAPALAAPSAEREREGGGAEPETVETPPLDKGASAPPIAHASAPTPAEEPRTVTAELTTDQPRRRSRSLIDIRLDRIRGTGPKEPNQ